MKIWKLIFVVPLLFICPFIYAKTPMYSTEVDQGLAKMFNKSGLVDGIYWSGGQITRFSDIGGGSGNATYPINLSSGTETTGIVGMSQGGHGSNTAAGARTNLALGSNDYVSHKGISLGSSTVASLIGQLILGGSAGIYTDSGKIITPTELEYSDGATSNIQNQLNAKISQVGGTCTGLVADNANIGGTNSTATFRTVTVTETLESGSQWSTTGSSSNLTGINYDHTFYNSGSGTVEIVHSQSGATTTVDLIYVPQVWAVGSSSVTGTTEATLTTMVLPAGNKMGTLGELRVYAQTQVGTTTIVNKTLKMYISDGVGTNTFFNSGAVGNLVQNPYYIIGNNGSTSTQVANTGYVPFAASSSANQLFTLNTLNQLTISFTVQFSTATTIPFYLYRATAETIYVP